MHMPHPDLRIPINDCAERRQGAPGAVFPAVKGCREQPDAIRLRRMAGEREMTVVELVDNTGFSRGEAASRSERRFQQGRYVGVLPTR
jgi:hypothetical protein